MTGTYVLHHQLITFFQVFIIFWHTLNKDEVFNGVCTFPHIIHVIVTLKLYLKHTTLKKNINVCDDTKKNMILCLTFNIELTTYYVPIQRLITVVQQETGVY